MGISVCRNQGGTGPLRHIQRLLLVFIRNVFYGCFQPVAMVITKVTCIYYFGPGEGKSTQFKIKAMHLT